MRKLCLIFVAIATLTLALALPSAAAVPNCKSNNNALNGNCVGAPGLTQATLSSILNQCTQGAPVNGDTSANTQCSKPDMSNLIQQLQSQLKGNGTCPTNNANTNCPNQANSNCNL